jgi:dipeptidyl aminopeptidase/acylaminoacyl peptidase
MFKKLFIAAAISVTLLGCSTTDENQEDIQNTSIQSEPIPEYSVDYFFKNSVTRSVTLSPKANYVAMLKPYKDRMNIFFHPINQPEKVKRISNQIDRDVVGYGWVSDDTVIYARDTGGDENYYLVTVNIDTGEELVITPKNGVVAGIIDVLPNQEDEILISTNQRDKRIFDVYRYNLKTKSMTLAAKNPGNYSGWMTDHDGKIRVAMVTDGVNSQVLYRDNESQPFKILKQLNFKQGFNPLGFTPDNKNLYVSTRITRDKATLIEYDVVQDKEIREIFTHPDVDISGISYSDVLNKIVSVNYTTWKDQRHFLDKSAEHTFNKIQAKLPDSQLSISSISRDEQQMIVVSYSDVDRAAYYHYDVSTDTLTPIAKNAPWHNAQHMSFMKPIEFTSRDGLKIHGYLTTPRGKEAKDLPLVMLPHGGPWARDSWGFQPEVQMFANRGYAVLQVNFRGSTGYGREFWEKSFKQWGQTMQNDITDGVSWTINEGIVDKEKICIYGGSYGGYATLAGVTYTPDLYKCGIDYVGVSNLFTFMESIPPYWEQYLAMLHEMVGHPEKDKEMMTQYSPVYNVDKIKAPLLVLQGAKDPRVVKAESDQIVEALNKRGVEVEYIVKENEGHGFRSLENRLEAYEAMDKFLKQHLKP